MSSIVASLLPRIAQGAFSLIASRMQPVYVPEDPTIDFLNREMEVMDRYQARMAATQETPPATPARLEVLAPAAPQDTTCPFCRMEEKAGTIKNHLDFVAMECTLDGFGPATGGMIPKALAGLTEVDTLAREIQESGSNAGPLAELALQLSNELKPKLGWVGSCEEAQAAAKLADGLWMVAAKAAQVNFSHPARRG